MEGLNVAIEDALERQMIQGVSMGVPMFRLSHFERTPFILDTLLLQNMLHAYS